MLDGAEPAALRARSLFLSDIHLGTRACRAGELLSLLREYECENIFLVGDIIDFWAMSRGIYWPELHNTVVQKILKKARHDVRVYLIPGNHDEALREYIGSAFGDINLVRDHVHTAADGKRYLLLHGDEFDQVTRYHRWLAVLGDVGYNLLVRVNASLSRLRRLLRRPGYWSLAGYAKQRIKGALEFIYGFEEAVAHQARIRQLDGVICGHIHSAVIKDIDGVTYINCGDWVDSCTAIIEHFDGRMELVYWNDLDIDPAIGAEPEVDSAIPHAAPIEHREPAGALPA